MFIRVYARHPKFDNVKLGNYNEYEIENEGKSFINISNQSKTKVGVLLHPTFQSRFNTIIGSVRSLEDYIAYFIVPGYDSDSFTHVLGKSVLYQAQNTGVKFVWPDNYHSILLLGMVDRMFTLNRTMSNTMLDHFKLYEGEYTSFHVRKPKNRGVFAKTEISLRLFNQSLGYYCEMVGIINDVVYDWDKSNDNDDIPALKAKLYETALKLKANKSVPIFNGTEHIMGDIPEDITPEAVYELSKKSSDESSSKKEEKEEGNDKKE